MTAANEHRRDVSYTVGDLVLLSTAKLSSGLVQSEAQAWMGWAFPVVEPFCCCYQVDLPHWSASCGACVSSKAIPQQA